MREYILKNTPYCEKKPGHKEYAISLFYIRQIQFFVYVYV